MPRLRILLRVIALTLIALALSSCRQAPTALPTQAKTETAPRALPTIPPTATQPPTLVPPLTVTPAPPSEPETLTLGQPFWIGRGKILGAMFLPSAQQTASQQVAIAWGSGVSLNDVESGQEVWFQEAPANLIAFDVQPGGQVFAAALADGSVMVFDAAGGEPRRFEVAGANAYWGDIAWSPDGQTVAFQFLGANRSSPIYLLDVASGDVNEVPGSRTGEGVGPALVWSPDGASISVAALGETCARFIDVRSGETRMRLGKSGQCYSAQSARFLPDGLTVAVNGLSGGVDLLSFPDGNKIGTLESDAPVSGSWLLEFPAAGGPLFTDRTGQWLASRGGYEPCYCDSPADQPDHPLVVWDLVRGAEQARLSQSLEPLAQLHRLAAAFDGESIVMLYENGQVTRWAFGESQAAETAVAQVPARPAAPWTLSWAADGSPTRVARRLAFTGAYGGVDVYALESRQLVGRFDSPLSYPALSADGKLIALFDPHQNAELVYNVRSGALVQVLPAARAVPAAFSPDGLYLAYGSGSSIAVAELSSGAAVMAFSGGGDLIPIRMVWSPDGQALAAAFAVRRANEEDGGAVVLWKRLEDGSFKTLYYVQNVQAGYGLPNQALALFNPSGSRVALQSLPENEASQMALIVFDLESEQVLQTFQEYRPGAWVSDEELLAAEAQYDTRLTRIDVLSGEKTVGGMSDSFDLAYAPGGVYVAQMAAPPARGVTIRHWQSGEVVASGEHLALNLIDYGWSPDGRWLASIGDDGTLRVWGVEESEK